MQSLPLSRRSILLGTAAGLVGAVASTSRAADTPAAGSDGNFTYEVTRTDAEWQAMLSEKEYEILRSGGTEFPTASPYWKTNDPGTYHCKGCDLPLYSSVEYSPQKIGFVFFNHAIPNAIMTGVDETDYNGAFPKKVKLSEVHCRRCGSHLGHHFLVKGPDELLHCINGTALLLRPAEA